MRRPRKFVLCFFLTAGFVLASGCADRTQKNVIAVEKTGTYHRQGCPPLNMAKTKIMTVREAKAEHLRPCPTCKPDTL